MIELKPCPFCGGEAKINRSTSSVRSDGYFSQAYSCGCKKCDIFFYGRNVFEMDELTPVYIENGLLESVEVWNRRADHELRS